MKVIQQVLVGHLCQFSHLRWCGVLGSQLVVDIFPVKQGSKNKEEVDVIKL